MERRASRRARVGALRSALALAVLLLSGSRARAACPGACPFDLVDDGVFDSNGWPANPRWRGQAAPADRPDAIVSCGHFPVGAPFGRPRCTQDVVTPDGPSGWRKLWCSFNPGAGFEGHLNWPTAIAATGNLRWSGVARDDDYNWDLAPPDGRIVTAARPTLVAEADGRETLAAVVPPSWWATFRDWSDAERRAAIDGQPAAIAGLLGIDNAHRPWSELHPVYGLAILLERQVDATTGERDDHWAVLLRTWGNEGYCSSEQHLLSGLEVASCGEGNGEGCVWIGVDLPLGATAEARPDPTRSAFRSRGLARGPFVTRGAAGVTVRFVVRDVTRLPRNDKRGWPFVYGELWLRWTPAQTAPAPLGRDETKVAAEVAPAEVETLLELFARAAPDRLRAELEKVTAESVAGWRNFDQAVPWEPGPELAAAAEIPVGRVVRPEIVRVPEIFDLAVEAARERLLCAGAREVQRRESLTASVRSLGVDEKGLRALLVACREAGRLDE